jgi:hypothetical protein
MTDAWFTDCDTSPERMAAYRSEVLVQSLSQLHYSKYSLAIIETSSIRGLLWGLLLKGQAPTLKTSVFHVQGSRVLLGYLPAVNKVQDPLLGRSIPFTVRCCGRIKVSQATKT